MDPPSFSRRAPSTQLSHPILGCDSIQSWKCDYMPASHVVPKTIDEYISAFSPEVQAVLQRVRQAVCSAAPDAQETISYRIPAFKLNGMLVYFAAFTKHIGFYPPRLEKAVSRYAGEKGNLRFPTRSTDPLRLDQAHHQASRETEPGETHNGAQKERIAEQYLPIVAEAG